MKILVTGYTGQLGYDVVREGMNHGYDMVGIGSKDLDITNEVEVMQYIEHIMPDAIIHCAAYTGVDKAEEDKEVCWEVNVNGTEYLTKAAKQINAKFMYISTDYVFDGDGETAFDVSDVTNPIGYYGLTKLEGENTVKKNLSDWFIVRISWVFGINGNNFVKTMLRLSENHHELNVVGDQIGSPTYTYDLAKLLITMITTEKYGIYHASNEDTCSWADFAEEIFNLANKNVKVNKISTEEYPTKARRPKNSRLSKQMLLDNGFQLLPSWKDSLKHFLNELNTEVK